MLLHLLLLPLLLFSSSVLSDTPPYPPSSTPECLARIPPPLDTPSPLLRASIGDLFEDTGVLAEALVFSNGAVEVEVLAWRGTPAEPSCFGKTGFSFHVHDLWLEEERDFGFGEQCSAVRTGGHFDPSLACGPKSGSPFCLGNGGSVPPSRLGGTTRIEDDERDDVHQYRCSPREFQENPFVCEVGDLSGKFGKLKMRPVKSVDRAAAWTKLSSLRSSVSLSPRQTDITFDFLSSSDVQPFFPPLADQTDEVPRGFWVEEGGVGVVRETGVTGKREDVVFAGESKFSDPFLKNPCVLENRSIVFHCEDASRVFCGKFSLVRAVE